MIRIYKDNDIKLVTQGVYNNLYKPLGYKPVIEEKKEKTVINEPKVVEPEGKTVINKESSKINQKSKGE